MPRLGVTRSPALEAANRGADFDRVRAWALVNLEALVVDYAGLELRRGRARCPIHGGDNPEAFSVTAGKGWHCHTQCATGGDGVDLVRRLRFAGLPDKEGRLAALRELAPRAGVFLEERGRQEAARGHSGAHPARSTPRSAIVAPRAASVPTHPADAALAALALEGYVVQRRPAINAAALETLTLTDRGAAYLAGRGLDPAAAARYGFRSVDDRTGWRELEAVLRGCYLPVELEAAGWHALPWGGEVPALVIPFHYRGECGALRFRRMDGKDRHKYDALAGVGVPLPFNADALEEGQCLHTVGGGELHIAEGELDAYTLTVHGLRAVGIPGAGSWRADWTALVQPAGRLVAWYDADAAGATGRAKLAGTLAAALGRDWLRARGRSVTLPDGDVNETHRAGQLAGIIHTAAWRTQ